MRQHTNSQTDMLNRREAADGITNIIIIYYYD
jgi:hypothetical protein